MFEMDTGQMEWTAKSSVVDEGQDIRFTNFARADRAKRQVIEQIESFESSADVDEYTRAESVIIDALYLFDPIMADEIADAAEAHKSILKSGGVEAAPPDPHPAVPGIQTPQDGTSTKETKMNAFADFDAGSTGSEGPWLQWSARGTQDGAIPPRSFLLRDSDGKKKFDGFEGQGVVLDIENMQTGWCYSDGITGQAPEWKMNQTVAQMMPQPGEGYKKGFKIRCAIGGGKTASWDQAGAAAWNAFVGIVPALREGPAGQLPLVRMTDTRLEQFKRGSTVTPILEVVKWVPRPDCLKADAQMIDTGDAQTQAPAAAAATAAPEPATADSEYGF